MNNPKSDDLREILDEGALKRIETAFLEGSAAREEARKQHSGDDPESVLLLRAAHFDYAFLVLAATVQELKRAGIHGERLREIMRHEIEGAANSLDLGVEGQKQLHDLLDREWGW